MPRPKSPVPAYLRHKTSGQAYVRLTPPGGRRRVVYLGRHGSAESRVAYTRLLAELATAPAPLAARPTTPRSGLSVSEVVLAFMRHALDYYRLPGGGHSSQVAEFRLVARALRTAHGDAPAAGFGPLALKEVRQRLVDAGLARVGVNARVGKIKHLFRWAASEELVPGSVYHALQTVAGLRAGRTAAPERQPVRPADPAAVAATLPHLPAAVADMVRVQSLSGMRPGEACRLRPGEVDRSGAVWVYRPATHKTRWRGKERAVYLGPQAQAVLGPYLAGDPDRPAFSPAASEADRHAGQRAARQTRVQPSQQGRRAAAPQRPPGEEYCTRSYSQAVRRAARAAGVGHWSPNQLRHAHATLVRKRFGLEAAGASLGHAKMSATEVYAERDQTLAERVAAELG